MNTCHQILTDHVAVTQLVLFALHHVKVGLVRHCHGHPDPALVAWVNFNNLPKDRMSQGGARMIKMAVV